MDQFATYSKFYDAEDASFLLGLLKEKEIPYETAEERNQLDHIYLGESLDPMFAIKIPREKFSVVNSLFAEKATNDFSNPDFSYYLHEYDVKELKEIIQDSDHWNPYDVQMAKLILQQKSGTVPRQVDILREEDFLGERIKTEWLVLAYLLTLVYGIGIFIGWSLAYSKKTMSDGHSVFMYDAYSQRHGRYLIVIGVLDVAFVLLFRVLR